MAPTLKFSLPVSAGLAPTGLQVISMTSPDPFRPDVNAHLTLSLETEQSAPAKKDLPRITFALTNLGAPPLLPTVTLSTDASPLRTFVSSSSSSTMTMTASATTSATITAVESSSANRSSAPSSNSSKSIASSSSSDHGLYRVASTASSSYSSQASSLTSGISAADMSLNAPPPKHPNVPAILLGCLLIFIILTLIGSSLSWCFFSKNQRKRRQQENSPWMHDEERNDLDSPTFDQASQKSTAGHWFRAGEGDMTEVSLASPVLNRRGPGFRSPVLPAVSGVMPNQTIPVHSEPSSLPQMSAAASTTTTPTKAPVERPSAHSTPSVQELPAHADGKKLVVVNSAPEDVLSSDSESLIGPRKTDDDQPFTHSRRWKL